MWFKSAASSNINGIARRSAPLILSDGFRIDGDMRAREVHIAGTLIGNLVAGKVTLGENGSE